MEPELIRAVRQGEPLAVARAITRVERGGQDARDVIRALFAFSGHAHLIGITGAPGTGKSTLVNGLAKELQARGRSVAILAIDPSSPFTHGAILGDRFRMQDLAGTGVYIRSMASRGELGGLAAASADAITVLDAAGFDAILIETVGAGQGEVEIARHAHTTLVLEAPGFGDDIQAIKAGILEIADILVVNKADREGVNATIAALQMNLHLSPASDGWHPPLLKTIALKNEGISQLADEIEKHRVWLDADGRRERKDAARFQDALRDELMRELLGRTLERLPPAEWDLWVQRVNARECDVYSAATQIMEGTYPKIKQESRF